LSDLRKYYFVTLVTLKIKVLFLRRQK